MFSRIPIKYFLFFLLFLFLLKELIFALVMPLFQNPDEQIHYGTIQFHAEPKREEGSVQYDEKNLVNDLTDIRTYRFSEEVIQSAISSQFDEIRWQKENKQSFSDSVYGKNEGDILNNNWEHTINLRPTNASGTKSYYYDLGTITEKILSSQSIFTRVLTLRFLSTLFGVFVVFVTYFTAKISALPLLLVFS